MKHGSIHILPVLLACIFCFAFFTLPVFAIENVPEISAGSVYLLCMEPNTVVYQKNADAVIYPASTVKIMTGYLGCKYLSDRLDEQITLKKSDLGPGNGYRCLYLSAGDTVTVRDLLYGVICGCDYDACYVIAILSCGSVKAFLNEMNRTADALGATHTSYTNPTGVHDTEMVTTAADTARIARAAAGNALFMEVASARQYVCSGGKRIGNRNALVSSYPVDTYYDSRCHGLNTGSTDEAGYCLVTTAKDGDYTYLCVLMGVPDENRQYVEAVRMIDWAFSNFGTVQIVKKGTVICTVPVKASDEKSEVALKTSESFSGYFPLDVLEGADLVTKYVVNSPTLEAPVAENQAAGYLTVTYRGELLAGIPLVTDTSVSKSGFLGMLLGIRNLSGQRFFRASLICAAVLLILYFSIVAIHYHQKRNRRRKFH